MQPVTLNYSASKLFLSSFSHNQVYITGKELDFYMAKMYQLGTITQSDLENLKKFLQKTN